MLAGALALALGLGVLYDWSQALRTKRDHLYGRVQAEDRGGMRVGVLDSLGREISAGGAPVDGEDGSFILRFEPVLGDRPRRLEIRQFLDAPGVRLLGASLLPAGQTQPAWEAFTKAIGLTPYDPDAYMVRSVACVGLGRAETALDDVTKALELDPRNPRARAFAWSIAEVAEGRAPRLLQEMSRLGAQRARSADIVRRYGIQRPDQEPSP